MIKSNSIVCLLDVNEKPVADAGGNFTVELPRNSIIFNGTRSKDDWAIVKWEWTRTDTSLAVGNIVEKTDESPILILTDPSVGYYIFNLTVYDEQGLSDTDTAYIFVKNDPKLFYLVQITLGVDTRTLTRAQYKILTGKLALLVLDGNKLNASIN